MSNFVRNVARATFENRDDFYADGRIWNMSVLQKIRCAPRAIPTKVLNSIQGQPKPQAKATAKPANVNKYKALAKATPSEFRKQVEELMQTAGCDRMTATRLLSEAAGLSKQQQSGNYFDRLKQSYRR